MHIPDGILDTKTAIGTGVLSLGALGYALHHAKRTLAPRKVPLLGLSAAFIFAAQMINFPVAGGTSGHLVGGVLVAALLGPSAAVIVISTVLIVQCFAFADGGITALGANIFNMGVLGGAVGGLLYQALAKFSRKLPGRLAAAMIASWVAIVLASIAAAGELTSSGKASWNVAFPIITGVHAVIGIGEAAITALVLSAIAKARPELVLQTSAAPEPVKFSFGSVLVFGMLAAIGLALFVSPFASKLPDGLDYAAEHLGLPNPAQSHYTALAAALATLLIFLATWGLARLLIRRKPAPAALPTDVSP